MFITLWHFIKWVKIERTCIVGQEPKYRIDMGVGPFSLNCERKFFIYTVELVSVMNLQ